MGFDPVDAQEKKTQENNYMLNGIAFSMVSWLCVDPESWTESVWEIEAEVFHANQGEQFWRRGTRNMLSL